MISSSHPDRLWQPLPLCADAHLRHWLRDRGSLTQRIQSRCARFRLQLLSQRSALLNNDEHAVLGVRADRLCLVREVTLNCGVNPVVFAHSVVEASALRGPWHMLANLGVRPLGAVLFADSRVRRYPLRFHQLSAHDPLYRRAGELLEQPPAALWARRSLYVRNGARLLVTEVFLPGILALSEI